MPFRAFRKAGMVSCVPPSDVRGDVYDLKVEGMDAVPDATEVVYHQPFRDRTPEKLITPPVSPYSFPFNPEPPVPVFIHGSCPQKTAEGSRNNIFEKSLYFL